MDEILEELTEEELDSLNEALEEENSCNIS